MVKRGKEKNKSNSDTKGLLLENFVLLQKTLVETVSALKEVDKKITSLLELFEDASRSFKEKEKAGGSQTFIASKLAAIEEQNKVIAKTLLLLEKQMREKEKYGISRGIKPLAIEEAESIKASITKPQVKKKKIGKKAKEAAETEEAETEESEESEPLFKEDFGSEESEEATEETEESGESEESGEEFRPKPLPEFSF